MAAERLADHAKYRITLHRARRAQGDDRGPLVITFGGQPSGPGDAGFGTGWALQHGWDTIHVAQRHASQYQGLDHEDFAAAILPASSGRDLVCYGSSLGGYAALYYAGAVGARVLAASPMFPAWPPLERTHDAIPIRHRPLADLPATPHSPIVLYDPMVPGDAAMVERMVRPVYPAGRYATLPFAGHTTLQALSRTGMLKPFVRAAIVEDRLLPLDFDRSGDPIFHFQKGRHLAASDPAAARRHFEASLALEPSRHVAANLLGTLLRLADRAAAQALLERYHDHPEHPLPESALRRAALSGLTIRPQDGAP